MTPVRKVGGWRVSCGSRPALRVDPTATESPIAASRRPRIRSPLVCRSLRNRIARTSRNDDGCSASQRLRPATKRRPPAYTLEWTSDPIAYFQAPQASSANRNPAIRHFEIHAHIRSSRTPSMTDIKAAVASVDSVSDRPRLRERNPVDIPRRRRARERVDMRRRPGGNVPMPEPLAQAESVVADSQLCGQNR